MTVVEAVLLMHIGSAQFIVLQNARYHKRALLACTCGKIEPMK